MTFRQSQSWLSTARRRAKEGFLQAMGGHVASEDQEFDDKYKCFLNHINELQKMEQLMELWIESFDAFCLSTTILTEAWSTFHSHSPYNSSDNPNSPYAQVSNELSKACNTIQRQLQPLLHETFSNRCLKPVNNILALVPELNEQIQLRKAYLLDFDSYKAKIQKELSSGKDNNHPNVQKKSSKLEDSARKLHEVQSSIYHTFYEFENARAQTLGPELATFVACCHTFSSSIYNTTSRLLPLIPQAVSSLAALDYSAIATELKFDRIDSTPLKASLNERKIISPLLERTEVMGGKHGGYGVVQSISNGISDQEAARIRNDLAEKEKRSSRVSSIRFKEPISTDEPLSSENPPSEQFNHSDNHQKSSLRDSSQLNDRALPLLPPEKPPRASRFPEEGKNPGPYPATAALEPTSPSSNANSSRSSSPPPKPPPKPPRTRRLAEDPPLEDNKPVTDPNILTNNSTCNGDDDNNSNSNNNTTTTTITDGDEKNLPAREAE